MSHGPSGRGHKYLSENEKAKDFKGTIKKLLAYIKVYRFAFMIMIAFAIGSTVFSILGPAIMGKATTEIFNGLIGDGINFPKIKNILLLLLCLYLVSALFSFIQGFIMTNISQKLTYNLRKDISEKIHRLPMKYFDMTTHGEVLSRITNDVDTLSQSINQSTTTFITSVTMLVGVLVMMLRISPLITLVTLVILPLSMFLMSKMIKHSQRFFVSQQEFLGNINGQVEETYGGHNIIKAFNKEKDTIETFKCTNEKLYRSAWKSQFFSGMMAPIMTFVGNLGYVAVSIIGAYLAIIRVIEVGEIQAFIQYIKNFTQPIQQIAQAANLFQSTAAAAERVFEFLEEEEEDQSYSLSTEAEDMKGTVEFRNVRFGYSKEKIIINDFSLDVKEGQKIAIVGPTGAGKTTIIKLLMRFYDLNSGKIFLDGHDIKELKRSEVRKMFGMVLQDTWLFHGTIEENIKYGRPDATHEEVVEAAKAAYAHHFIQTLPDGYDMVLNEEAGNVSQGQKQLLTIARVILADPKILILDEATSSVDTRTEAKIQKAMDNLMEGRTCFVIAHRLSTIRDADLILVMNNGDIVEQGRHQELLDKKGFYAELYNSQFETDKNCA